MLTKYKHTLILTALLVCGMALTALALTGQFRWMKSAKTNAAPKASIKSILPSARSAAVTAPIIMFQGPGIAQTGDPGGFDIDGNLQANTPTNNVSDWLPNGNGTGVGMLTPGAPPAGGQPLDPTKT